MVAKSQGALQEPAGARVRLRPYDRADLPELVRLVFGPTGQAAPSL